MKPRFPLLAVLIAVPILASTLAAQNADLFSQATSAELARLYGGGNLSWLLLDRTGRVLSENWDQPNLPISPGSLLKPFITEAYGEQHGFVYPRVTCSGTRGRCWLPRGHGTIEVEQAISESCNTYFLSLANGLDRKRAVSIFAQFGLHAPPADATAETLIGLTDQWRETPLTLARAFLALAIDLPGPAKRSVLAGMRSAAESGTARNVDLALGPKSSLAKTGTARCSHHPRGAADGFAVVLFPTQQPRVLLLVRMHGATGASTATQAGAMLRAIGMGTP